MYRFLDFEGFLLSFCVPLRGSLILFLYLFLLILIYLTIVSHKKKKKKIHIKDEESFLKIQTLIKSNEWINFPNIKQDLYLIYFQKRL